MGKNKQARSQTIAKGNMLQDRYAIEKVLGENGLSITYEVTDTFRHKKMAIKELFPKAIVERNSSDWKQVSCILLSHEALFNRMCENTIKKAKKMIKLYPLAGMSNVVHYFEENQTVYIVMEFVEGISFPEFVKKRGGRILEFEKAVNILMPVMESLKKIHKAGLVYGKISLNSIVLNEKRQATLLGFGDPLEEAATEILDENTAREMNFAPVEQFVPDGKLSPATDVYSVAAVLYYCITGVKPPAFYERVNVYGEHIDPLKTPWDLKADCTSRQSEVIMKALSVYQFDRHQSISEFLFDLDPNEFEKAPDMIYINDKMPRYAEQKRMDNFSVRSRKLLILVAIIGFLAVGVGGGKYFANRIFYTRLNDMSLYEKCEYLDHIKPVMRKWFSNDYEKMTNPEEAVVTWYDLTRHKRLPFEKLDRRSEYEFIRLDFRAGDIAYITTETKEGTISYKCYLEKYGSYYIVEQTGVDGTILKMKVHK